MWLYHPELDRKIEMPDSAAVQMHLSGWQDTDPPPPPPPAADDESAEVLAVDEDEVPTVDEDDDVESTPRARKPVKSKES